MLGFRTFLNGACSDNGFFAVPHRRDNAIPVSGVTLNDDGLRDSARRPNQDRFFAVSSELLDGGETSKRPVCIILKIPNRPRPWVIRGLKPPTPQTPFFVRPRPTFGKESGFFQPSFPNVHEREPLMSYASARDFDRMHSLDEFCALIGCRKTKAYDLIRNKKAPRR
jgi:hypothetical protein